MGYFSLYVDPFDDTGEYLGTQISIDEDVIEGTLSAISKKVDNDDYNVGLFSFGNIKFKVRNNHGKYSDVDGVDTIFNFTRGGSRVEVKWRIESEGTYCGWAECGASRLSEEVSIFKGFLVDDDAAMNIEDQTLSFSVLSDESIFREVEADTSNSSNGDTFSQFIYDILNTEAITSIFTVDQSNISVGNDLAIDDITDAENKTLKEVLDNVALMADAAINIVDDVIYVFPRTGSGSSVKTFYGPGAFDGVEDIVNISKIRTGVNKMINLWRWPSTSLVARDTESIDVYGVRDKAVPGGFITDNTKKQTVLNTLITRFGQPKEDIDLTTPLTYESIAIDVFDKVSIDYPSIVYQVNNDDIAVYGNAVYGTAKYPETRSSKEILPADTWTVLGKKINKNETITFNLRKGA